ncbi:MAG: regulatory protein RecX [Thermodesulfovibrionales bacterium]
MVSSVINYLQHANLVNDLLLAEELKRKSTGIKFLSQKSARKFMFTRGIPEEIIDSVLTYNEAEDIENARNLVYKKMTSFKNLPVEKIKKKLHDLLLRKGYSYEIINMVLKEINIKED